jgi:hypothetical protein
MMNFVNDAVIIMVVQILITGKKAIAGRITQTGSQTSW